MMANLDLKGPLTLLGNLTLQASGGGKVTIEGKEILVEVAPGASPAQGTSSPVILPPPPAAPSDPAPNVNVINSFNKTVKIGSKAVVAQGLVMQGSIPSWPGMMLPSQGNTSPVTAGGLPVNVVGDQAIIFPSGGSASFSASGQQ
jgi:hypothetical protein